MAAVKTLMKVINHKLPPHNFVRGIDMDLIYVSIS